MQFEEIPPLPPIILSLDKPLLLDTSENNDHVLRWDTDALLGEYLPGEPCKILIYDRGLKECSHQLGIAKLALREVDSHS